MSSKENKNMTTERAKELQENITTDRSVSIFHSHSRRSSAQSKTWSSARRRTCGWAR